MENEEYRPLRLYDFEYRLIPNLIDVSSRNLPNVEDFVSYMSNMEWIINDILPEFKLKCEFETTSLKASVYPVHDKNIVIAYSFPEPQKAPLAKWGAIVINNKGIKYFTLEKSEYKNEYGWFLGGSSVENHYNYGKVDDCPTIDDFISLLDQRGFFVRESYFSSLRRKIFGKK